MSPHTAYSYMYKSIFIYFSFFSVKTINRIMELSDDGGGDSSTRLPSLLGQSQLKPKLDDIFAEVEKNLPSIDFDLSDVRLLI